MEEMDHPFKFLTNAEKYQHVLELTIEADEWMDTILEQLADKSQNFSLFLYVNNHSAKNGHTMNKRINCVGMVGW